MTIKQGTIIPTTGIGVGYLALLIYGIFLWNFGYAKILKMPFAYILPLIFLLMQFSYKDFIIHRDHPNQFLIRYRILYFIPVMSRNKFTDYSVFTLRVIRKRYSVRQAGAAGLSINTGNHKEEYYAIVGKLKSDKAVYEICKADKSTLDLIIKDFIQPLGIPVFLGAPKKGYEYKL